LDAINIYLVQEYLVIQEINIGRNKYIYLVQEYLVIQEINIGRNKYIFSPRIFGHPRNYIQLNGIYLIQKIYIPSKIYVQSKIYIHPKTMFDSRKT
jgi:hypothetical protein